MALETVETLLGLAADARVEALYERYEAQLLARLIKAQPELKEVPAELEYIAEDLTIARFNRIGSEGMTSESVDGHSASYADTELEQYEDAIARWLRPETGASVGRVKFI